MEKDVISLDSGRVRFTKYNREDTIPPKSVKLVVKDIYLNRHEFNEPITWIDAVYPNEGKTPEDVLDEFTEKYGEDDIIMLQAGTIMKDPTYNPEKIDDHINFVDSMIGYALNAYFYRVLFTRLMARSYGYRDICIYSNEKSEKFIKDNMSGIDAIIKSVNASGKIN